MIQLSPTVDPFSPSWNLSNHPRSLNLGPWTQPSSQQGYRAQILMIEIFLFSNCREIMKPFKSLILRINQKPQHKSQAYKKMANYKTRSVKL